MVSPLEADELKAGGGTSNAVGVLETNEQEDSPHALQQAINRLTLLGTIRDGILVSGAIFYAAGYLVWSSHAWLNNMGILPALDFQYFVAGCVPVLIVALAYLAGRFLWHFVMKVWPQKVSAEATGAWRMIRLALFALLGISFFAFLFLAHPSLAIILGLFWVVGRSDIKPYDELVTKGKVWRAIGILTLFALFVFVLIEGDAINATFFGFVDGTYDRAAPFLGFALFLNVLFLPTPKKDWAARWLKVFYFALTLLFLPLVGLSYYVLEVYPNWPQELGGVQPRCAYVDVSPETLSAKTRATLLPGQTADTIPRVTRSRQLAVLFSNDTYLLVRLPTQKQRRDATVYELKKDDLRAITWCD